MTKKELYLMANNLGIYKRKNKNFDWTLKSRSLLNRLIFNENLTAENICNLFYVLQNQGAILDKWTSNRGLKYMELTK